jgi:hypothetical protein
MNDNDKDSLASWRRIGDVLPDLLEAFAKPASIPCCSFCDHPSKEGVRHLFASTIATSMICSECVEWLAREIRMKRAIAAMPELVDEGRGCPDM